MHAESDKELSDILQLIRRAFAYMDGRIEPSSSMQSLTISAISRQCRLGEVWSLGDPIIACMFLTVKEDALYISKLSVSEAPRGRGIAKQMMTLAATRASCLNIKYLELFTRIELTENHMAFSKLGFTKVSEACHPGFQRPTYIIMRKTVMQREQEH